MGSVTVTDNGDGTATYAWSGFSVGGGVNVSRFQVSGVGGSLPGVVVVTGGASSGSVTTTTPPGIYFAQAYKVADSVSAPFAFACVDNALSIATRCRNSIIDTLKLLQFPEIGDKVYSQLAEDSTDVETFPAIICTSAGVQESDEQILSTRDDVGYPTRVMFCDKDSARNHARLLVFEKWREWGMAAFRSQQLMGVPESKINRIEPLVIVDPSAKEYEYVVSGFVVRAVCRQNRGLRI